MGFWESALSTLTSYAPALVVVGIMAAVLGLLDRFLIRRPSSAGGQRASRQFLMFVLTAAGILLVVLVLPMSDATRGQVIGLIGVLLTAVVALSSTTFVSNVMAGLMLRLVRSFKPGDFIRVGDHFGRVSAQGLFHTEIQTEARDLTTFPNLHLATNPMTVVRESGTIVSATLSLGYDVPHQRIEPLLKQAAESAGLSEPFAQVLELGDFSVTYRAAGFLSEVKQLISVRSELRRSILTVLHAEGVEIVSPTFMNQRVLAPDALIVPEGVIDAPADVDPSDSPEKVIFDKADEAAETAELEGRRDELNARVTALKETLGSIDDEGKPTCEADLASATAELEQLEAELSRRAETS